MFRCTNNHTKQPEMLAKLRFCMVLTSKRNLKSQNARNFQFGAVRQLLTHNFIIRFSCTVKSAEIRQENRQNRMVESPKLSGVLPVSSVKVSWFNSYNFLATTVVTLIKQLFPD